MRAVTIEFIVEIESDINIKNGSINKATIASMRAVTIEFIVEIESDINIKNGSINKATIAPSNAWTEPWRVAAVPL